MSILSVEGTGRLWTSTVSSPVIRNLHLQYYVCSYCSLPLSLPRLSFLSHRFSCHIASDVIVIATTGFHTEGEGCTGIPPPARMSPPQNYYVIILWHLFQYTIKMLWFWTQVLGSQLAAKTHQIQSPGSHFSWGVMPPDPPRRACFTHCLFHMLQTCSCLWSLLWWVG